MHNSFNYSTFTDLLIRYQDDLKQESKETSSPSAARKKNVTNTAYPSGSSSQRQNGPWRGE